MNVSNNIVWHNATVTRNRREERNAHRGAIVWFTGLSGAGKSTLAHALEEELFQRGCQTFVLDGDNVRHGLCRDLGFSDQDRVENIRRVGEVSKLFVEAGVIVLTAFISPFRADREVVRSLFNNDSFMEVFCDSPLSVCEKRDVKGLYKKAREGNIKYFTGISSPYETPETPNLVLDTSILSIDDCIKKLIAELLSLGVMKQVNKVES